jgi:hypothetical protein
MPPFSRVLCLALVLAPLPAFAEVQTILPGYWTYTASTILPGASVGNQCVRPDQIDEFMSGPHNRHYKCTYPSKSVGDGKAAFDGTCVGKHGDSYRLKVKGTYSLTTFNLKGHIDGIKLLGLPISAPIAIDAKRLAPECPAGSK